MTTASDSPPLELQHTYHARKPDRWPHCLWRFVSGLRYRRLRKWAAKNGQDFQHRCCFFEQVCRIGDGWERGPVSMLRVKMTSGQTALYRVTEGGYYSGTGQHDYTFEFQGYLPANK